MIIVTGGAGFIGSNIVLVSIKSISIPPPAPTKPQINPIIIPQRMELIILFLGSTAAIFSLVVITGFTINLIPNINVTNVEKLPMVEFGSILESQLPIIVNNNTLAIITRPLRISRFLFL